MLSVAPADVAPAGTFSFTPTNYQVAETAPGGAVLTVTYTPTPGAPQPAESVSVMWLVTGGTATRQDYSVPNESRLTFAPGQTTATLTVTPSHDYVAEPDETLAMTLVEPSAGTAVGASDAAAEVLIVDSDRGGQFWVNPFPYPPVSGDEGGTAQFRVWRDNGDQTATVDYATADGTATAAGGDYRPVTGTLTFLPGETQKTVDVELPRDAPVEPDETFQLVLSNPTGNASFRPPTFFDPDPWADTATILDGTRGGAFRLVTQLPEGTPEGGSINIIVERTGSARGDSTVTISTSDLTAKSGVDYGFGSVTLRFFDGDRTKGISIPTYDDGRDEADETVRVTLSDPTGASSLGDPSVLDAVILDNDPLPAVRVSDQVVQEGSPQQIRFTVDVAPSDRPVSLDYVAAPGTAAEGDDYAPVSGTLTFPAGGPRSAVVTVPVTDDAFYEPDEWFYLQLSNATNAEFPGGAATYRATATVRDNDPRPAIHVVGPRLTEGDAGDVDAPFTVTLLRPHNQRITVDYATADGTATAPADYAATSGTLAFEPGETSKTVIVPVHGDTRDESSETFFLNLRSPVNAVLFDTQAFAVIGEDDDRPPTADVTDVSPDPRSAPVDSVRIVFREAVSGFDPSDLALTRDGGENLLTAAQTLESTDGVTWTLGNLAAVTRAAGQYALTLTAAGSGIADPAGNAMTANASDAWRKYASVAGRHVFYNNSFFDGNDPAANAADDNAVAPDKRALLPGGTAGFANVTGYSRGLNGVLVDLSGLPAGAQLTPADFQLTTGNGGAASTWAPAPAPSSVTVRRGAGDDGSDRVTLTFPDGSLRNAWLRVTVLANARTGLAAPDVFYFGNLVGDAADPERASGGAPAIVVSARDLLATLRGYGAGAAPLASVADHNRDGRVNALDLVYARVNYGRSLSPFTAAAPAALSVGRLLDSDAEVLPGLLA